MDESWIYEHFRIDASKGQIRVLHLLPGRFHEKIHCKMSMCVLPIDATINVAPENNISYEALSYTWGPPKSEKAIYIDEQYFFKKEDRFEFTALVRLGERGMPLNVTRNLYLALRRLRRADVERVLWIDAICINQRNPDEKSQQVQMMGHIYSRASGVLVWLGDILFPEERFPDGAVPYLEHFRPSRLKHRVMRGLLKALVREKEFTFTFSLPIYIRESSNADSIKDEADSTKDEADEPGFWNGELFQAVLEATRYTTPCWWERVWTTQEFALSSNPPTLCFGGFEISSDHLRLDDKELVSYMDNNSGTKNLRELARRLACYRTLSNSLVHGEGISLIELYYKFPHIFAEDPRDHVYSVLSILPDQEASLIKPDYKAAVSAVFSQATFATIKANESLAVMRFKGFNDAFPGLPSWSVNFSNRSYVRGAHIHWDYPSLKGVWSACQGHNTIPPILSADYRLLTIQGCFLDYIDSAGGRPSGEPNIADYRRGRKFGVDPYELVGSPGSFIRSVRRLRLLSYWRQFLQEGGYLDATDKAMFLLFFENWSLSFCHPFAPDGTSEVSAANLIIHYMFRLCQHSGPCLLFVTRSGFVGIGPHDTRAGDTIALLYISNEPIILRPGGDGTYHYVGFAFVHGVMNGEIWTRKRDLRLPEKEFVLS